MKNIYLLVEDGEQSCVAANTMAEAITIGLNSYLKERVNEEFEGQVNFSPEDLIRLDSQFVLIETEFYHQNILQSCEFIGKLKNE